MPENWKTNKKEDKQTKMGFSFCQCLRQQLFCFISFSDKDIQYMTRFHFISHVYKIEHLKDLRNLRSVYPVRDRSWPRAQVPASETSSGTIFADAKKYSLEISFALDALTAISYTSFAEVKFPLQCKYSP